MLSAKQLKYIRSLRMKKFRLSRQEFIIEGTKLLSEAIRNDIPLTEIFVTQQWLTRNDSLLTGLHYKVITDQEMKTLSQLHTPPGILAIAPIVHHEADVKQLKGKTIVALDGINDPGNLGSIIRSADWFGVAHIFYSPDTVDPYNSKVVQASMGSIFRVPLTETPLDILCHELTQHAFNITGATLEGENVFEAGLKSTSNVLVVGSESHGIGEYLYPFLQNQITIPSYSDSGQTDSLNAAIATSIILAAFKMKN